MTWRATLPALFLLGSLAAPRALAIEHDVQHWQLEPGTDVLLVEDHRAPLVWVTFEFPVGHWSAWARDHHAEEAFDIQMHDRAGSLRERADRLSVDVSVGMWSHHAAVSASCLRDDLAAALELMQDVLANRDFDPAELKRWNKNDKLDWDGSQKDPEFRLAQAGARMLFAPSDPRRRNYEKPRPRLTSPERLAEARDVVVRLPGRVIAFSGDLTRADAERLATGLLPPVTDSPPDGLRPSLAPLTPMGELPREHVERMPRIEQTFFAYGRHSLTYDSPQYPAFLVADNVLGGHFFSRMYVALRHEGGETYGTLTTGRGGLHQEGYALVTFTRGDNVAVTEHKLREVLQKLHGEGITENEREMAVGYLVGVRAFSRQAPSQILQRRLWESRHGLAPGFYDALVDRARTVRLDEINAFILEFYDPRLFAMIKVSPE